MPSVAEEVASMMVGVKRARTSSAPESAAKRNYKVTTTAPSAPLELELKAVDENASVEEQLEAFRAMYAAERSKVLDLQEKVENAVEGVPGDARSQKLVNDKRKLALEVQALKEANTQAEGRVKALTAQVSKLQASGDGEVAAPKARGRAGAKLTYSASAGQYTADSAAEVRALEAQVKERTAECVKLEKKLAAAVKGAADGLSKLDAAKLDAKQATASLKEKASELTKADAEVRGLSKQVASLEAKQAGAQDSAGARREVAEAAKREEAQAAQCEKLNRQLIEMGKAADETTREMDMAMHDKDVEIGKLATKLSDSEGLLAEARVAMGGEAEKNAKRRKHDKGRFSVQDTDGLIDKLAHLQNQYLQIKTTKKGGSGGGRGSISCSRKSTDSGDSTGSSDRNLELEAKNTDLMAQVADLNEMTAQTEALVVSLESRVSELQVKLSASDKRRAELHNLVQELKGNIRVFCRVRPFLPGEDEVDTPSDMEFPTGAERPGLVLAIPAANGGRTQKKTAHSFDFDQVMCPATTQEEVFTEIEPLLQSVMDGFRLCIFAYGQTGSGKTFTMEGKMGAGKQDAARGAVPRSMERLMDTRDAMRAQGWEVKLTCSCLEIYNEEIRDLLSDGKASAGKKHDIQIDKASGDATVSNLSTVPVESEAEIYKLLKQAGTRRETATTSRNEASSRSHSVLQIRVEAKHRASKQTRAGMLNLVDLAGSERLGTEHSDKDRLKEAKNINMSLSSLLGVIQAIASKASHVPFRNSKLTHLLSSSLSGDGKALMFANISPRLQHAHESLNTLRFASQVNQCQIAPRDKK